MEINLKRRKAENLYWYWLSGRRKWSVARIEVRGANGRAALSSATSKEGAGE